MRVEIRNFRAFNTPPAVNLKPLTLLVGENSAGKSSFMALVRYILDFVGGRNAASFNREPFFLGSFDQVAHMRGGRGGRATEFGFSVYHDWRNPRTRNQERERIVEAALHVTFANVQSQPKIRQIQFEVGKIKFEAEIRNGKLEVKLDNEKIMEDEDDLFSVNRGAEFLSFSNFMYLARDIEFRRRHAQSGKPTKSIERSPELWSFISGFRSRVGRIAFASAPVRMEPGRIYSPTDSTSLPGGGHVPPMLARLKRHNHQEWEKLKSQLDEFGIDAGLFSTIDVKDLGSSESDPFQLIINRGMHQRNIIDVGYGVSQVLPIIVDTINETEKTTFLFQQPEVHLHPRAQASLGSFFVKQLSPSKNFVIETHSDYIIDRVRMAVRDKLVDTNNVSLFYFTKNHIDSSIHEIKIDKKGNIIDAPVGYRKFFLSEMKRSMR